MADVEMAEEFQSVSTAEMGRHSCDGRGARCHRTPRDAVPVDRSTTSEWAAAVRSAAPARSSGGYSGRLVSSSSRHLAAGAATSVKQTGSQ